jgi:nickel-dependent lactate racemase
LNEAKEILDVVAGEPEAVMQKGVSLAWELYQVEVDAPFDLMIVSPGGFPKDINLYQAQKGLAHAALVTKDSGTVILIAACPEGTGSQSYERWMDGVTSYQAVFERFQREGFRLGPHKAFQIARDAARVRVLLVSKLPSDLVRRLLLTPAASPDEAVDALAEDLVRRGLVPNGGLRVGLMPWANATIPILRSNR